MTDEERARQELRLSHRITESAVSHFKGGHAMWAKAGVAVQSRESTGKRGGGRMF